jgi:hypothetical protein
MYRMSYPEKTSQEFMVTKMETLKDIVTLNTV